jgi:hypothetical protein
MPRPHPTPPDPDPDRGWSAYDEEQPGVSIRALSHADLQALLAHLDHHDRDERLLPRPGGRRPAAGEPVVAVRVRASVGHPGASAHAEFQRRRAVERAAWTRSLPWRTAAVLHLPALRAALERTAADAVTPAGYNKEDAA